MTLWSSSSGSSHVKKGHGFDCTLTFQLFVVVISQALVPGVVSVSYLGCDSCCGCSLHVILGGTFSCLFQCLNVLASYFCSSSRVLPGGCFWILSPCQVGNDPGCHWRWSRYTKDEGVWCEIPRVTCSKWDAMRYSFSKDSWSCGTAFCYGLSLHSWVLVPSSLPFFGLQTSSIRNGLTTAVCPS